MGVGPHDRHDETAAVNIAPRLFECCRHGYKLIDSNNTICTKLWRLLGEVLAIHQDIQCVTIEEAITWVIGCGGICCDRPRCPCGLAIDDEDEDGGGGVAIFSVLAFFQTQ